MPGNTIDLSTYDVCLTCGQLRGGSPREQRCACQRRTGEWRRQWAGCDIAGEIALCTLCVRNTVTTLTRWSWLACGTCRDVAAAVGKLYGMRSALPLGRHSLMNGIGVPLSVEHDEARRLQERLVAVADTWRSLGEWRRAEFARLAEPLRGSAETVPLVEWLERRPVSVGASVDAFERYVGSPVPAALAGLREARDAYLAGRP